MNKILNEGLDYHDLEGQLEPKLSIDEYKAKMGKDSDIVTLAFIVNSRLAAEDLVSWLEIGYDYVLDASVSEGEISPGKYLVFVEMNRRTSVPARIIEILSDLETLTNIKTKDWTISHDDHDYDADEDVLKQVIVLSPHKYRVDIDKEEELNEMRQIAGLSTKKIFDHPDKELKDFLNKANL